MYTYEIFLINEIHTVDADTTWFVVFQLANFFLGKYLI